MLLLGGCKGAALPTPQEPAAGAKARTHSKSAAHGTPAAQSTQPQKIAMGTQLGGARQGVQLYLKNAVSTFAGKAGTAGAADGSATQASFDLPKGITTDGINLYLADLNNHTIRKIDIESAMVSTVAGGVGEVGYTNGSAKKARFFIPEGITSDGANLYVADTHNHSIRQIELENDVVTTIAGLSGSPGFADDARANARFSYPKGITTDGRNLYVVDFGNHRVRKIVISSAAVTTLAGSDISESSSDEQGEAARFNYPTGITSDGRNLYVVDTFNRTVRKIVIANGVVTTIAGKADLEGSVNATGTGARFRDPVGITTDGNHLFVTDSSNHTVRKIR